VCVEWVAAQPLSRIVVVVFVVILWIVIVIRRRFSVVLVKLVRSTDARGGTEGGRRRAKTADNDND
jgi:hypothetical protein